MVSVENNQLRGGGQKFKQQIWEAARPTIEAWTGMKLQPTVSTRSRSGSFPLLIPDEIVFLTNCFVMTNP